MVKNSKNIPTPEHLKFAFDFPKRLINRITNFNFAEFEDLLFGETKLEEFSETVSNMSSSEPEGSREVKMAERYGKLYRDIMNHLLESKQITQEQFDKNWVDFPYGLD